MEAPVFENKKPSLNHLCLGLFCALAIGCSSGTSALKRTPDVLPSPEWTTKINSGHPLVGQIWSTQDQTFMKREALVARLSGQKNILIGERHDQPDHHRIQAWLINHVSPDAAIGFEMLDEDDAARIKGITEPETLRKASEWDQSGWPEFSIYQPIFEAIHRRGLTVKALHPARSRMMQYARGGPEAHTVELTAFKGFSPAGQERLRTDIDVGHCGHANDAMIQMMVAAQIFKDRWMTAQLKQTDAEQKVVIAGNGHVRKDYGIPNHLSEPTLSIGLIEVVADQTVVADYMPERFDYIWFTPRLDTLDPCEKYKEALERMKSKYKKGAARGVKETP